MRARPLLLLAACAACATPPSPSSVAVSDGRYAMGTVLEITLYAPDARRGRAVLEELFAVAARLDSLLSIHDASSEVSRLNRAAGRGPLRVDPLLADLLARSIAYAELTDGAFDVTLGPLVELWTGAARRGVWPGAEALARARSRVGSAGLRLPGDGTAELARQGASVDLGGIAKGYALERMRPVLRAHRIERALLNFGQSSSWALGAPPGHAGWRLLARGPGEGGPLGVITLRDRALSVSGSLGQFVEIAGRRLGHVLDPRSGEPLTRRRQALVVAPDAALAEALSKALLVLGEAEGLALVASQPGCQALLVDADGGGQHATPGWQRAVAFEALP